MRTWSLGKYELEEKLGDANLLEKSKEEIFETAKTTNELCPKTLGGIILIYSMTK